MTILERLEFCTICDNRKIDLKVGLICKLSNKKPDFENKCETFSKDSNEAERKLKLKLDAAGNSRTQDGSLKPKRNIIYGILLLVIGIIIFLFSIVIGGIIIITGISFIIKGNQQKKILTKNKLFNEKLKL
jgi:hypothetical protein